MVMRFDVAVIGAGPAGSAAAIAMARSGYDVALIDKQIFPREKLCGDFVNPINWPMFRDLGVEERILALPHTRVNGFRITSFRGISAEASFAQLDQGRSFGLGLKRAHLDQALLQRAEESGVTLQTGCRVKRISKASREWQLEMPNGADLRAKVLVGADGRNSWVARQLGMNRRAATRGRAIGFQTRIMRSGDTSGRIEIHLFPGGYAGLVGVGDGTVTMGLAIEKRVVPQSCIREFLLERMAENPYLKTALRATPEHRRVSRRVSRLLSQAARLRRRRRSGRRRGASHRAGDWRGNLFRRPERHARRRDARWGTAQGRSVRCPFAHLRASLRPRIAAAHVAELPAALCHLPARAGSSADSPRRRQEALARFFSQCRLRARAVALSDSPCRRRALLLSEN